MNNPRVSVIMPAFCCEATISESIRSVLGQTFSDWELLIVDDGSKDRTAFIAETFAEEDPRIRLIRLSENRGVANARNVGAESAKADWIAFLDSDDIWYPEKLGRQFALTDETNAQIVYSGAVCIDEQGRKTGRMFRVPKQAFYRSQLYGNDIVCSTVLIRKDLFLRHPMERSDLHEDYLCWLACLRDGAKACGITEPLIQYRVSATSKSGNKLRSAGMMWRTYQHLGFGFGKRLICFMGYALHGITRYFL